VPAAPRPLSPGTLLAPLAPILGPLVPALAPQPAPAPPAVAPAPATGEQFGPVTGTPPGAPR
ncbi:hypothetical protein BST12_28570, partial [Mycobacterium angelicum]